MERKKWPTWMPKVERVKSPDLFLPPPGWDPGAPLPPSAPPPLPKPLPCDFHVEPYSEPFPFVTTLRRALQRHRLLFLWYAYPEHVHVPGSLTPGKQSLYDALGLPEHGPVYPAETIFKYANEIEAWLTEQQAALGTGPKGKPLRDISDDWPTPHFAYWAFEHEQPIPLHQSYIEIARLVGVALRDPKPDWIGNGDVLTIRRCENIARPLVADDTGTTWKDRPLIQWHFPDVLRDHAALLEPLALIESGGIPGATGTVQAPAPAKLRCAVVLNGQGEEPTVLGQPLPRMSGAAYRAIEALVGAGPEGLSKDQLEAKTNTGARKMLEKLAKSDPRWGKGVQLPGVSGMGYRLLHLPA